MKERAKNTERKERVTHKSGKAKREGTPPFFASACLSKSTVPGVRREGRWGGSIHSTIALETANQYIVALVRLHNERRVGDEADWDAQRGRIVRKRRALFFAS